ncbi:MAG: SGNH/GDSL hydrolase family protein [Flavobacteriales bacterium]|nr:SGNH/GDSL hydrolase family protein [Flavobacteriales bacterium]
MIRNCCVAILASISSLSGYSQCSEDATNKVLLVGDSWAFFMGVDQTINTVLERWGHSDARYLTNLTIAENGAETDDFLTAEKQDEIEARLIAEPSIKVVHLSIGGNDVLGDWNVEMTTQQTDSLEASVRARLVQVIDFILNVRPDVHVLWSGYMYPNFEEVIELCTASNAAPVLWYVGRHGFSFVRADQ